MRQEDTHQELEYRRLAAGKLGLNFIVGPNGPNLGEALASEKRRANQVA
jgi:hypothetical protein